MFAFLRFCFLCLLAVVSGVAAVSVPVAGHTPAEHVRRLVHRLGGVAATIPGSPPAVAAPSGQARAGSPASVPATPALARKAPRPPADNPTAAERAALDELIGKKTR
jgi:hypothetical protein